MDMAMSNVKERFKVTLGDEVIVKPCRDTTRNVLELSGIDRISPAIFCTLFFYRASKSESTVEEHREKLQESLEKVLVSWYSAAGRLRLNGASGKLEIDCNGEGVTMRAATTDAKLEDLGNLHEHNDFCNKLVHQISDNEDLSQSPLVAVQVTRFACGGYCVGFGFNHALFDGFGAFSFLASWAQICCGKDVSELIEPNHCRGTLMKTLASSDSGAAAGSIYSQTHVSTIRDLCLVPMKMTAPDDSSWGSSLSQITGPNSDDGTQFVTLCLKREIIKDMKRTAVESGALSVCSTFDVLSARVWKARVRAFKLHPTTSICLQFPVNARNRTNPALGENFTGNAFVLASIMCTVTELVEEPLEHTIARIQSAKRSISDEYVKAYLGALECREKFLPSMRELTIVSDWTKFCFHEIDFGEGRPAAVSPVSTTVPEVAYLMPDLGEEGGMLVRLGIEGQYLQEFINNLYGNR
ncbi:brassinosteroid-related acyltransferase 1-like [Nymphaea colorata]|nr:brassinosteroid-related acyltransferase 1-like [Nymphaea colorata]